MNGDLTRKQVMEVLNISTWELRRLERDNRFPRIMYNPRVIRYSMPDILHFRECCKKGGWIEPDKKMEVA